MISKHLRLWSWVRVVIVTITEMFGWIIALCVSFHILYLTFYHVECSYSKEKWREKEMICCRKRKTHRNRKTKEWARERQERDQKDQVQQKGSREGWSYMAAFHLTVLCVCVRWATARPTGPVAEQPVGDERGRPAEHGRGNGQPTAERPRLDQHLPSVQWHVHCIKEVRYNSVTTDIPLLLSHLRIILHSSLKTLVCHTALTIS